ncbi:MAG: sigma 54-interacting transcriptional regulator [Desulfatitalea sp.]|nr:sigma 54-interacting transcriptional regulator [Desulfatitalea sp.]NNK00489.1 sigma 54-interacting transcriptional regulator [Desulfatitalea sp.]
MDREMTHSQTDVILDSINEGVFTVGMDWRISTFNRAAERITGIDRREAIGQACCDVFHANICEQACPLRKTFDSGRPVVNATAHIVNNQGARVPIRISTAILRDNRGKVIGGVETFQDLSRIEQLQKALTDRYTFEDIVGRSESMRQLFRVLPFIAESSSTVLIEGPSGTGKELFARAIHNLSARRKKRFVAVNCAALPDTLLESELFGHKAGAFTDARRDKPGRFELADGGTILLDEIGDISEALQARLLRVLQDRCIEPLGAVRPKPVNIRVVAATNKNLAELVRSGKFREDLYYRVRVVHLVLPSLEQRREDIPLLIDYLVNKFNRMQGKGIAGVSADVAARLMTHDYPGNVRELENIIEQAFVLCRGGLIEMHHLPPELRGVGHGAGGTAGPMSLDHMQRCLIAETLTFFKGNRALTAQALGIHPTTLYRKIQAHHIDIPRRDGRGTRR